MCRETIAVEEMNEREWPLSLRVGGGREARILHRIKEKQELSVIAKILIVPLNPANISVACGGKVRFFFPPSIRFFGVRLALFA